MLKHLSISLRAFTLSAVFFRAIFLLFNLYKQHLCLLQTPSSHKMLPVKNLLNTGTVTKIQQIPAAGFESHARIFKYRIYLHDDFMQKCRFQPTVV
jgi:hypothetical protein